MNIEIWSDIACPFCYIGKVRLEKALNQLDDIDAIINWRSFELDPNAPDKPTLDIYDTLAKKYQKDRDWAMQMNNQVVEMAENEGLTFNMNEIMPVNTFKAHRLIHYADKHGKQHTIKERLLKAYFSEGLNVNDTDVLAELAEETGLNRQQTLDFLSGNEFSSQVIEDIEKAHQVGVQGVPFFLINEKYGLSGAQPVEVFKEALQKISNEMN